MRAFLLTILLTACLSCQAQPVDTPMEILFYRGDVETPLTLDVTPTEIESADAELPPPVSPGEKVVYARPFANAERNGRAPVALGDGLWEVAEALPLREAFPAQAVLWGANRVLVQQEEGWQLFGRDGTPLAEGARVQGDLAFDVESERFYANDHTGYIRAYDLTSGEPAFALFPMFGRGYDRSVVQTDGSRLWIVGTELPVMSHRETRPPEYTILEIQNVGGTLQKDEDGVLLSNHREAVLITRPVPMLTAATGEQLVLVAPGHVFLVDAALQVMADLQGDFTPLAVSMDEAGLIYLVVRVPDEQGGEARAVWGLTPQGQRVLDVPVPEELGEPVAPPLVGYDRTVYAAFGAEVLAMEPGRGLRWRQHAGEEIVGGAVTADGQMLVSAGPRVLAIDAEGERRLVFEADGDTLRTAPVLASPARLYVASASALYRLKPMD